MKYFNLNWLEMGVQYFSLAKRNPVRLETKSALKWCLPETDTLGNDPVYPMGNLALTGIIQTDETDLVKKHSRQNRVTNVRRETG